MQTSVLTAIPNGVEIAYRRVEPRVPTHPTPIALVHGMGGDSRTWDGVARSLARQGRTVIAVDLRGHGRSARAPSYRFGDLAQDVAGLCEHLGLEQVDLVGHSLGGVTASLVAQQRSDLVRRLVLEEMPVPLQAGDPAPVVPRHRPSRTELWNAATGLLRNPRGVLAFDRALTDPAMSQFQSPNPQWWEGLPKLQAPTLFLRGARPGSMVDPRLLADMTATVERITVRDFDCGHSIHRDRSREFRAAVEQFLA
ncbi:alpha/beta fold hydrolase [Tomitella biformata]|uniref:alpha/beta fold hydrolase n=1 Tax=Tomitella biformata TaxID=630403 RepID=UPI0004666BBD|nr:alpha/beta hydrolase [Tomitella biformata]